MRLSGAVLGLMVLLLPSPGGAFQIIQDCTGSCGIEVVEVAVLGGEDAGEGFVGRPRSVVRMSDGRYLVADLYEQDRIKVYGPNGVYEQSIGRGGEGPGEYVSVEELVRLDGDTLEVYDAALNRFTVLDPQFEVVDTRTSGFPLPSLSIATLPDGTRILSQRIATPRSVGLPLHIVSPDGDFLGSFGAEPPIEDIGNAHLFFRRLAKASDSTVWAAHRTRYTIEEWSVGRSMLRSLDRDVPWFEPGARGGFVDATAPPNPELGPFHVDRDGLLWVVIQLPAPNWEEGLEVRPGPYGARRLIPAHLRRYQNSLVEIIDPVSVRVVARVQTDHRIMGFVEDGWAYAYDETASGEPMVRILELTR